MNDTAQPLDDENPPPPPNTLDPPGSIVVVGGGPLGIETALYGRFLGYNVTLVHEESLDHFMRDQRNQDLPVLPDRCLSSLAMSALDAQSHELGPQSLPLTVDQWIEQGLRAVCQSDLLLDRVKSDQPVTMIKLQPAQTDAEDDIPDDFRITLGAESIECEALILADQRNAALEAMIPPGTAYCFVVPPFDFHEMEPSLLNGYHRIVAIFAELMGRADLDLYRPNRSGYS